ncbi:MAG: hypothetical protein LBU58_03670 [Clostridiales bacterium]|jgi:hypothetical protein|nr:hypothetical protein [Clostridiales bacterium]
MENRRSAGPPDQTKQPGRTINGGPERAAGRVNCPKCVNFYVTWDASFPRGCKLYGFKTSSLPYYAVLEATGKPCENYREKTV